MRQMMDPTFDGFHRKYALPEAGSVIFETGPINRTFQKKLHELTH